MTPARAVWVAVQVHSMPLCSSLALLHSSKVQLCSGWVGFWCDECIPLSACPSTMWQCCSALPQDAPGKRCPGTSWQHGCGMLLQGKVQHRVAARSHVAALPILLSCVPVPASMPPAVPPGALSLLPASVGGTCSVSTTILARFLTALTSPLKASRALSH